MDIDMTAMIATEIAILAAVRDSAQEFVKSIKGAIGDYAPPQALKSQVMLVVDQLKSQLENTVDRQLPSLLSQYEDRP